PDPATSKCVKPFHDPNDINTGGPHRLPDAIGDINGGKMNGFISQLLKPEGTGEPAGSGCDKYLAPKHCGINTTHPDAMGYHDSREIPNYWTYAKDFVLQDHMFEPNYGWSLPAHLFMVSAWSAKCTDPTRPMTCTSNLEGPSHGPGSVAERYPRGPLYGWTDLTYLLHRHGVSWGYYLVPGKQPDCADSSKTDCRPKLQRVGTPSIWNPLPSFTDVRQDGQVGNVQ